MKPMHENLIRCESDMELHPHWSRDKNTWIVYDKLHIMTQERWCHDCLDTYRCKFANHILDLIARKDVLIFKRK